MNAQESLNSIKNRLAKIRKQIDKEHLRHKKELAILSHEVDLIQLDCQHEWRDRSIMGRDTVTECEICGKER